MRTAPAVWGGYVYATADDGNVYGFNASTGDKVWNYRVQQRNFNSPSPAVANGFVYVGADGVYCFNASTGEKVWNIIQGLVDIYPFSSPVIAKNEVYVWTTADQYMYCLDGSDGSVIWRGEFPGGNAAGSPAAIADGVLYVADYDVVAFGSSNLPVTATSSFPASTVWIIAFATTAGTVIVVAALLIYRNKRKQLQPSGSVQLGKLKKRFSLTITAVLIAVIALAAVAIVCENGFPTPQGTSPSPNPSPTPSGTPNSPSRLWQKDIGHQAMDVTVDDGKVFAVDDWGNVFAFNAQSGESLWNATQGSYGGPTIEVYEGSVYVSGAPSVVGKFNETDGRRETVFSAPYDYGFGSRSIARFSFINGRIVIRGYSGDAVYNTTNGELFWENSQSAEEGYIHLGNTSTTAANTDSVLIRANAAYDLNNGSVLWRVNGSFSEPTLVSEGKIIFWNYDANGTYGSDSGHMVSCVNASSGATLWSFDAGASAFQPTIYNDLLLLGASDGNFYALSNTDGKLIWSTHVDTKDLMAGKNLPANSKYYSTPAVSPVLIDSQAGTVTWAFAVTQFGVSGVEGKDLYIGVVSSLNLSSGHSLWSNQVVRNGSLSSGPPKTPILGLVSAGSMVYLTSGTELWTFNASTGVAQGMQHFDYAVRSIVTGDGEVFLIEDIYLIAYS